MAELHHWSMLLEEVLEIILSRLGLADHIRFGAVCKHWRSIAERNSTANKPFCLVRSADPVSLIYRLLNSFSSMQWHHARFLGSIKGWLALRLSYQIMQPELGTLDTRHQLILLNPGSRVAPIPLPLLGTGTVQKVVLSSPPDESSADKCVIVYKDCHGDLRFCRLGDTVWTHIHIPECPIGAVRDIVFYKEQLYAIDRNGLLRIFDSGLNSAPTCCLRFPPCFEPYMLVSSHKLLLIQIEYPFF